jgi:hypothetical protein
MSDNNGTTHGDVIAESTYGTAIANGDVTNDDGYTGMEDANVPAVEPQSTYGTAVPAATVVSQDTQNVYGTAVAQVAAPSSNEQPGEYSVMRGGNSDDVPMAQEPSTYTEPVDKPPVVVQSNVVYGDDEPAPMAESNVLYGDDEPASAAEPTPVAESNVVYGDEDPVVIRANPLPTAASAGNDDDEDEDGTFGFDAAENADINPEDFTNSKGKVVKKQVKAAVKSSEQEVSKVRLQMPSHCSCCCFSTELTACTSWKPSCEPVRMTYVADVKRCLIKSGWSLPANNGLKLSVSRRDSSAPLVHQRLVCTL